jgi:hypothetical protein
MLAHSMTPDQRWGRVHPIADLPPEEKKFFIFSRRDSNRRLPSQGKSGLR